MTTCCSRSTTHLQQRYSMHDGQTPRAFWNAHKRRLPLVVAVSMTFYRRCINVIGRRRSMCARHAARLHPRRLRCIARADRVVESSWRFAPKDNRDTHITTRDVFSPSHATTRLSDDTTTAAAIGVRRSRVRRSRSRAPVAADSAFFGVWRVATSQGGRCDARRGASCARRCWRSIRLSTRYV